MTFSTIAVLIEFDLGLIDSAANLGQIIGQLPGMRGAITLIGSKQPRAHFDQLLLHFGIFERHTQRRIAPPL